MNTTAKLDIRLTPGTLRAQVCFTIGTSQALPATTPPEPDMTAVKPAETVSFRA